MDELIIERQRQLSVCEEQDARLNLKRADRICQCGRLEAFIQVMDLNPAILVIQQRNHACHVPGVGIAGITRMLEVGEHAGDTPQREQEYLQLQAAENRAIHGFVGIQLCGV